MNDATNTVKLSNGDRDVYIRVTKHANGRISGEVSLSIVWNPIGGLRATRRAMAQLEADGFKVVAAA